MPSYSAHGDTLHYDVLGTGDPLVVLGGGPARHPDYLSDLGGLAAKFSLLLIHLRGVGRSPFPSDPALASWSNQADDVEALRQQLGVERVTVVGHSAGTRIALAFAARFPRSLERLVLITPPAGDLVDEPSDVAEIRARRAGELVYEAALRTAQDGPPKDGDDERLTAWQQAIAPISYAVWDAPQRDHARIGTWSAAAVGVYGMSGSAETFRADLGKVTSPVRVIAASEDGVTGRAAPLAVAALFPDGRAATIEGAGHYPWVDRPAEFLAAAERALGA